MNSHSKTIYFAQHGLAVNKSDDPKRPLSDAGIQQTRSIADRLAIVNTPVSKIFHSGKLRAAQTAEIFASALGVSTLSIAGHLLPNDDVILLADNLDKDNSLYIGHLPHLEKLVSYLVTENEHPNIIKFQNSAVVCLQKSSSLYQVHWYLSPELLTD